MRNVSAWDPPEAKDPWHAVEEGLDACCFLPSIIAAGRKRSLRTDANNPCNGVPAAVVPLRW